MSLLSWLFGPRPAVPIEGQSVMMGDETRPLLRGRDGWVEPPQAHHFSAPTPKPDQKERREQLYAVVRESMTQAGVLSASYKFKVLSLDRRGTRFLVMVDLARAAVGDAARLSEIEVLMAQTCKARHGILVTAVYWRMHDHVAVGVPQRMAVSKPPAPAAVPRRSQHEPLAQDEVAAFKRALAGGGVAPVATRPSARPLPGVRETPAAPGWDGDRDSPPTGLGSTQYGDLQ